MQKNHRKQLQTPPPLHPSPCPISGLNHPPQYFLSPIFYQPIPISNPHRPPNNCKQLQTTANNCKQLQTIANNRKPAPFPP
jgi:hypothetical protein